MPKFTSEAHSDMPSQLYSLLIKKYASIQVKYPNWFLQQLIPIWQMIFVHLYLSFIPAAHLDMPRTSAVHSNIPGEIYSSLTIFVLIMLPSGMSSSAHSDTLNATLSLEPSSSSYLEE